MKILLLNKHPVISKLVRLSAQKLEYEFDEQAHYADTLPLCDVIVVDDSVSADLKDLQNKCKKLICISSAQTNLEANPKILHKPFLPTDLIALMKDDEKPAVSAEQNDEAAQESVADDAPLDLDSLSFDMPEENVQASAEPENAESSKDSDDTNVYLQDIKEDSPESESINSDDSVNLDGLNFENSADTANLANETPDNTQTNSIAESSPTLDSADLSTLGESTAQDESANSLNSSDLNAGELNLGDLDFADTNSPASVENAGENSTSVPNLDEMPNENSENLAENSATSAATEQADEPKDELSIEPIDFVETPLPTLENTTNSAENTEQTSTQSQIEQTPNDTALNSANDTTQESENVGESASNETANNAPDEDLAFDSKDIADIMGLDEKDTKEHIDTLINEPQKTQESVNNLADIIASTALDEKSEPSAETAEIAAQLSEIENAGEDTKESASAEESGVDELLQAQSENLAQNADDGNAILPQENPTQTAQSELVENEILENAEQADTQAENLTQSAENPAQSENADENVAQNEPNSATQNEENSNATQNESAGLVESTEFLSEANAPLLDESDIESQINTPSDESVTQNADENADSEENLEKNNDKKVDESENLDENSDENAKTDESQSADEGKEIQSADENSLDLDLQNAEFLQPLSEPFSIEEKQEGKISFDDLPENAQFLGQKSDENVEADEIRPVLLDEPKAQSTQDMVKEQLAALSAMDNEAQNSAENESSAGDDSGANAEILAELQGLNERDLQVALGEVAQESQLAPSNEAQSANLTSEDNAQPAQPENKTPQSVAKSSTNEVIDELSKGISGAITSSIKDDALKAALKGMNMHIDINIKFDEGKA